MVAIFNAMFAAALLVPAGVVVVMLAVLAVTPRAGRKSSQAHDTSAEHPRAAA
jgi:hypothetical protein